MTLVPAWALDPAKVDLSGDITLVVARRSGRNVKGYKVEFAKGAGEAIRHVCQDALGESAESALFEQPQAPAKRTGGQDDQPAGVAPPENQRV